MMTTRTFCPGSASIYIEKERSFLATSRWGVGSEEPAKATLTAVSYDEKQHLISFQAKLSTGTENSKAIGGMRESRETISFTGTIYPDAIRGRIVRRDGYSSEILEEIEDITLKKSTESFVPDSYAQWKAELIVPPVAW